jgi:hypothetical protein
MGLMAESELHLQMKQWIADEYIKKGISKDDIKFEKILIHKTIPRYDTHTVADVFIKANGGTAVYCQCNCNYLWLCSFLDKKVPTLKDNCSNIIVVVPYNLEMLYPVLYQRFYKELRKEKIDVISAPLFLKIINKSKVPIEMSYKAIEKLYKLRNKYNPDKSIINFIENDLERLVRKSCKDR